MLERFPKLGAVCRLHTSSYRSVRNLSNGLMQISRFNGNSLAGVKALLRATPERICYTDQSGTRHSSVVHILSLEINARDLATRPALGAEMQYFVRESEAERAPELAAELYSQNEQVADERVDSPDRTREEDERNARIRELGRRLGYREVKTRMLLGQWAGDLAGLERRRMNELDQQTGKTSTSPNEKAMKIAKQIRRQDQSRLMWKGSDLSLRTEGPRSQYGPNRLNYCQREMV